MKTLRYAGPSTRIRLNEGEDKIEVQTGDELTVSDKLASWLVTYHRPFMQVIEGEDSEPPVLVRNKAVVTAQKRSKKV